MAARLEQQERPDSNGSGSSGVHQESTGSVSGASASIIDPTRQVATEPTVDGKAAGRTEQKTRPVVATADQISRAPVGSSNHRIWKCQAEPIKGARAKWSREVDRHKEASCGVAGHPA